MPAIGMNRKGAKNAKSIAGDTDFFFEWVLQPGRRLNCVDELAEVDGMRERVPLHLAMIRVNP